MYRIACMSTASSFLFPLTGRAQQSPAAATSSCAGPEAAAFDFTVGRWRGTERRINGRDTTVSASALVEVTTLAGGCALLEQLTVGDSVSGGFRGVLLRGYDRAGSRWMYTFVSNFQHFLVWEGRLEEGRWWFYRQGASGDSLQSRLSWAPVAGGVRETGQESADGGRTWRVVTIIDHTPLPEAW